MKRLTFIFLLFSIETFAQDITLGGSSASYKPTIEPGDELLQVKMSYGNADITNITALKNFKYQVIKRVELVYTQYSEVDDFDQEKLNTQRRDQLLKIHPKLLDNPMTSYEEIGIKDCKSADDGHRMFHGFNIIYRPLPSLARTETEIKGLMKLLEELDEIPEDEEDSEVDIPAVEKVYSTSEIVEIELADTTSDYGKKAWKRYKKGKETDIVTWTESSSYVAPVNVGSLDAIEKKPVSAKQKEWLGKSTIGKVMERHPEWKDMMVVVDVTGSMYAYIGQVMLWLKLNEKQERTKQHVFFNDGDVKPQHLKIIGKTGGIYTTNETKFDEVIGTALKAMRGGCGGDGPENNLEATIEGLKTCTTCGDIIMIADNWATPRDIKLYKDIDRPVKIILCGSSSGINVEYLNLARKLKGSVHTIEKDLDDLAKLSEGESVEIGGATYKIKDGKFVIAKRV